jgi:hypothetical protein
LKLRRLEKLLRLSVKSRKYARIYNVSIYLRNGIPYGPDSDVFIVFAGGYIDPEVLGSLSIMSYFLAIRQLHVLGTVFSSEGLMT